MSAPSDQEHLPPQAPISGGMQEVIMDGEKLRRDIQVFVESQYEEWQVKGKRSGALGIYAFFPL